MLAHIMARRTTQLLTCAAAVGVLLLSCGPKISADPVLNGWRITFDDEFDGGAGSPPNPSIWLPDVGGTGWGNNELQYYTPGENTYLDGDGHLVIEAREGSGGHSCQYGRAGNQRQGDYAQLVAACHVLAEVREIRGANESTRGRRDVSSVLAARRQHKRRRAPASRRDRRHGVVGAQR